MLWGGPGLLDRHQEVGRDLSALMAPSLRSSDTRHVSWGDNRTGRPLGWEAGLLFSRKIQKSIAEGARESKQQSHLGKCSKRPHPQIVGVSSHLQSVSAITRSVCA